MLVDPYVFAAKLLYLNYIRIINVSYDYAFGSNYSKSRDQNHLVVQNTDL